MNTSVGSAESLPGGFVDTPAQAAKPAAIAPELRIYRTIEELDRLRSRWEDLTNSPQSSPFQGFAWNRAWYRHYGEEFDEALVFVLHREGTVTAILPCYRTGQTVRLAGDNMADYQDSVADGARAAREALDEVFHWAKRRGYALQFERLSSRGWLAGEAERFGRRLLRGGLTLRKPFSVCLRRDLPDSFKDYIARLPRKSRGEMRRHLKRLHREFPGARAEVHRAGELSKENLESAGHFHRTRFRKEGVSLFEDPRFRALLEEVSRDPASGLRISRLENDGETMAVDVGFNFQHTYFAYLTAFDSRFHAVSPGLCLLLERTDWMMRQDGIRHMDFLLGTERYKREFASASYRVNSYLILPVRPAHVLRWGWAWSEIFARRVAKRFLIRFRLQKFIRPRK